jgi:hypothetical protein
MCAKTSETPLHTKKSYVPMCLKNLIIVIDI